MEARAYLFLKQGKLKEAIADMDRVLQVESGSVFERERHAKLQKQKAEALKKLKEASQTQDQ